MSNSKQNKLNGLKIVLACLLIQALPYAILAFLQPQFQAYVLQDKHLGFTVASFSLIFSIGTFASAVASPIVSKLFAKFGVKPVYIAGAFLGCGAFAAFSVATAPWQFYVLAALMQVGAAILSALGIPMLINAWFDESSKGKALSTVMAGGSLSNVVLQTICVNLLNTNGFRHAYFVFGMLGLAVALPAAIFLIRLPKNDSEIVRGSNKKADKNEAKAEEASSTWGYTVKEAMKTNGFKLVAFGFFCVGIYSAALATQYPNYLHQNHHVNTGTIGSLFSMCSFVGSIVGGFLFDKIGPFKTMLAGGILTLCANMSLVFALDVTPLAYVFAICKGLSIFTYTMGPALLVGKLFGNKDYAGVLGMVQLLFGLGFALGSSLFGVLVSSFGYTIAWYTMAVAIVISFAAILSAIKIMDKLNKKNNDANIAA